jgi:hypothetical protein
VEEEVAPLLDGELLGHQEVELEVIVQQVMDRVHLEVQL